MFDKKIKIIQYFVGTDEKYLELATETSKINKKYAEIHDYTYVFDIIEESNIESLFGTCTHKDILAYKDKYIYDNLMKDDCDYLVFIDADAAISKPQIKIEELIDNEHEIFLSRGNDIFWQNRELNNIYKELNKIYTNYNLLSDSWADILPVENKNNVYGSMELASIGHLLHNAGFYIIKNTDKTKELFHDIISLQLLWYDNVFPNSVGLVERSMSFCLSKKKYNNLYTYMHSKVQGTIMDAFNFKYDVENTFILHEYGNATTIEQKINEVKKIYNNKWWNKIESNRKKNTNIKIDWTKYVDAIYCLHFLPYKYRLKKLETTLNYIDILNSPIFHLYYTYPNVFDEMIAHYINPTYPDYFNERRRKTLNLNIAYHNMFREIQELGYEKVLLLEDDFTFVYGRKKLFIETLENLPTEWDYIQFDKMYAGNRMNDLNTLKDEGYFYSNFTGGYYGTSFTMWSNKTIDIAVKLQENDLTIADHLVVNRDVNIPEINILKRYIPKHTFIYQFEGIPIYNFS